MRLSPSNKESRPYPLKDGDIIQLGIDYQGKTQGNKKKIIISTFNLIIRIKIINFNFYSLYIIIY